MCVKWLTRIALACVIGLGPAHAASADAAQALSIVVHGDGAQATQLAQYDPAAPIDVHVRVDGGQKLDGLTIVGAGPRGESLSTPMVRLADGSFGGSLALASQGAWSLRISSRIGKISTDTTPITVDVSAAPPSDAWAIGLGAGVAIFVLIGGGGFFILRRAVAVSSEGERSSQAA